MRSAMFKLQYKCKEVFPNHALAFLYMLYLCFVIASIVLFETIVKLHVVFFDITISGSVIPYTFLYPISFIVLRVYGYKSVNQMIFCMILTSLIFTMICHAITSMPSSGMLAQSPLKNILQSSYQMYFAGFLALPAGMYSSFLALGFLEKIGLKVGITSLSIATAIGETINTLIVFPIGFHGRYTLSTIFGHIITDTLIFKLTIGIILAIITVFTINYLMREYEL